MKHTVKFIILTAIVSWYGSAFFYGFMKAEAKEETNLPAPPPPKCEVICTFEFPPLPESQLRECS